MKMKLDRRNPIQLFYKVRNLVSRFLDPNFSTFRKFEYKVNPTDELNDLKKLRYVRNLELAESGFINTAIKQQLKRLKNKDLLFQKDRTITPIGRITFLEGDTALRTILLGYCKSENKNYLSYNKVHNCPVWHTNDDSQYLKLIERIYPSESDKLLMKHRYFHKDVSYLDTAIQEKLLGFFNAALQAMYSRNKFLQNGIQKIAPPTDSIEQLCHGLPLRIEEGKNELFVPTTIHKDYVILVPYLAVSNDQNRVYFSAEEFRSLLGERFIAAFAETKMGLSLGTFNDKLFLKKTAVESYSGTLKQWTSLDDFLASKNVSKLLKYKVVNDVIRKKDFFVKTEEIPVHGTKTAIVLHEHYGSGKTFYALMKHGHKPKLPAYRPIASLKEEYPNYYPAYMASRERNTASKPAKSHKQKTFKIPI
ncbi:hypothetical protein [Costertonia aggregata]|uniref:Uncharacterized protein n=1 Tax=Costertonia aggregata TaxID=343403 RepID=A0A7H9AT35_9FLAO|nr:hypothetical protein [Costertonia aggregata]QLG46596.1 hypothetical protein HYG79_14975 [Costertonia aggregata]